MNRFVGRLAGRSAGALVTLLAGLAGWPLLSDAASVEYREPDPEIVRLLTAAPPPTGILNARARRVALLYREPVMSLDRLMQPRIGLAGYRLNPVTRTEDVYPLVTHVDVLRASVDGAAGPIRWKPAGGALLDFVTFSPDGQTLSALAVTSDAAGLVLFDIEKGRERRLDVPVNAAWGNPCTWTGDVALICRVVPAGAGTPPAPFAAPLVIDHEGEADPERTYAYLLKNAFDDALFEHYFSAELARVGVDGRVVRVPGVHGLIEKFHPSPDGAYAVINRIERPYSRLLPARRFPSAVEVRNLATGELLYDSANAGGHDSVPTRAVWKPGAPTTLGFMESRPGGDGGPVYRWMEIAAPFDGKPHLIAESPTEVGRFGWTSAGTPSYTTPNDEGDGILVHVVGANGPRVIWSGSTANDYENPGRALGLDGADGPVLEANGQIYLAGDGETPSGPRPMLDRFDLRSGHTERVFESEPGVYERVLGLIDPKGPVFVTSRESESDPPRLYLHDGARRTALTGGYDPYPQLASAERRVLSYSRQDGVALSGTLYLPAGRREGERLPTLVWIYPYEFTDRQQAEQLDLRAFRFHQVKGPSPLAAVLAGYAVLMNPTVPILYEGSAVNDNYLPQLVSSLDAAVDHLVALGVTDPARVAVAGRSYGAFSSANLLIHSDRFATAICMSGAYNRTLTPFGFQHEKRSFWEAGRMYADVSPFFHANEVKRPLLIIHGGDDENSGTPPMQARRFVHALIGEGAVVRYVELPLEGHHYWARENVLLASAEMLDWLDRTIGNDRPAATGVPGRDGEPRPSAISSAEPGAAR